MVVHDEFSRRVGLGCLGSVEGEMDRERPRRLIITRGAISLFSHWLGVEDHQAPLARCFGRDDVTLKQISALPGCREGTVSGNHLNPGRYFVQPGIERRPSRVTGRLLVIKSRGTIFSIRALSPGLFATSASYGYTRL